MGWLALSLLAAVLNSVRELVTRRCTVRSEARLHPVACAFRSALGVAAICLAYLSWLAASGGLRPLLSALYPLWPVVALGIVLEALGLLLYFFAMERLEVGTLSVVYSSTPLWLIPLNHLVYNDGALTPGGLAGVGLLFVSVALPAFGSGRRRHSGSGLAAALATAILFAGTNLILKKMTVVSGAGAVACWYPLSATLLGLVSLCSAGARLCLRRYGLATCHLLVAPLTAANMGMTALAYGLAPAAWVLSAKRAGVLFTVVAGAVLLKERTGLGRTLASALLAVAGLTVLAVAG